MKLKNRAKLHHYINTRKSGWYPWYQSIALGFTDILDGLVLILSFGMLMSDFSLRICEYFTGLRIGRELEDLEN